MLIVLLRQQAVAVVAPPARLVVVGPGNPAVQLITAKKAKSMGYGVTHFIRSDLEYRYNALMYGNEWKAVPSEDRVEHSFANTRMGSALAAADALVLCAEGGGASFANTINFARGVQRIVLLSAIGGSKGIGGNLGEAEAISTCEREVASCAAAAGIELSIVRVGVLKGGGAPADACYAALDAAAYYATLQVGGYPTPDNKCTKEYDKYTLGATCTAGDAIAPRNAMLRSGTRTSHSPAADEISRVNVAAALLACLRSPAPLELSLSAADGSVPPSDEQWDEMLQLV